MKRKALFHLSVMLVFLTFGVGNVLADYSITFKANNDSGNEKTTKTDLINTGGDYISSCTGSKTSRTASDGLLFGNSNNAGSLTLTMSSSGTKIGQIQASKITVKNLWKPSSKGGDLNYTITYTDDEVTSGKVTAPSSKGDEDINLVSSKTIKTIYFYTSDKAKRFYMSGFDVVAATGTSCTAPTAVALENGSFLLNRKICMTKLTKLANFQPSFLVCYLFTSCQCPFLLHFLVLSRQH